MRMATLIYSMTTGLSAESSVTGFSRVYAAGSSQRLSPPAQFLFPRRGAVGLKPILSRQRKNRDFNGQSAANSIASRPLFGRFRVWSRTSEGVATIGLDLSQRAHRPVSPSGLSATEVCTLTRGTELAPA